MTRYLLMPLRSTPLILTALFAVLEDLAQSAGYLGIPLYAILLSWFFKYCYVLLDNVVAGEDELPVLSVEMVNPVNEQRPLVQAAICGVGIAACWWIQLAYGQVAALALGALLLCALPATVGLLAISDSWLQALSPLAIVRLIKGLGLTYVGVVGIVLGGGLLLWALETFVHSDLLIAALAQLIVMAMFCVIGGGIFEKRVELQLATRTLEERLAEREDRHHAQERAAVLDRSYSLLRLKRRSEAWENLEPWIRRHCPDTHPFTEYHALLTATCIWDDPVIGDRVANEYLVKLLANGENGMALDALQIRLASNPAFYPAPPQCARRLTELAALAGRKATSRQLLGNGP